MPITPDHSSNFPHTFEACPECGQKGVYLILGRPLAVEAGVATESTPNQWRCKYCKQTYPLPPTEWKRSLAAHRQEKPHDP